MRFKKKNIIRKNNKCHHRWNFETFYCFSSICNFLFEIRLQLPEWTGSEDYLLKYRKGVKTISRDGRAQLIRQCSPRQSQLRLPVPRNYSWLHRHKSPIPEFPYHGILETWLWSDEKLFTRKGLIQPTQPFGRLNHLALCTAVTVVDSPSFAEMGPIRHHESFDPTFLANLNKNLSIPNFIWPKH